jgi:hypothetical protein
MLAAGRGARGGGGQRGTSRRTNIPARLLQFGYNRPGGLRTWRYVCYCLRRTRFGVPT